MKKILISLLALLFIPGIVLAATSVPWYINNLTDTYIAPTNVNGASKGVIVNASSTIVGGLTLPTPLGITSGGTNNITGIQFGALYSSSGSTGIVAAGTGYTIGDMLTVSGGTCTAQPKAVINATTTPAGSALANLYVTDPGKCTSIPSNPVTLTGGTGSGATFNLSWGLIAAQLDNPDLGSAGGGNVFLGGPVGTTNLAGGKYYAAESTFIGGRAGKNATSGGFNTGIGFNVMGTESTGLPFTGSSNVAIGTDAMRDATSSQGNVVIGAGAAHNGNYQQTVAIGFQALVGAANNGTGNTANTAIGYNSMSSGSMTAAASGNTTIGYQAGKGITTGSANIIVGDVEGVTTGTQNTLLGQSAGSNILTGNGNVVIGFNANLTSDTNDAVMIGGAGNGGGNGARGNNQSVIIGAKSGSTLLTGTNNDIIGYQVGNRTITTGNHNILIGTGTWVDTPTASTANFLNIGNLIYATGLSTTNDVSSGNVGIGTSTPQAMAHVVNSGSASANGEEVLRLSAMTPGGTVGSGPFINFTDLSNVQVGFMKSTSEASNQVGMSFGTYNSGMGERLRISAAGNVGIATTSPTATFSVDVASSTINTAQGTPFGFLVGMVIDGVRRMVQTFDYYGHRITSGPVPVLSSCGTSTISGNDSNGTITLIGVALTSCTMTLAHTYAAAPDCVVSDNTTASTADLDTTATTVTFGLSVGLNSGKLFYQCAGHQ